MCLPVSKSANMMAHSNYCRISWAKGGRLKCLINSFFPKEATNDTVKMHSSSFVRQTTEIGQTQQSHSPLNITDFALFCVFCLCRSRHAACWKCTPDNKAGRLLWERAFRELVGGSGNSRRAWTAAGQPVQTAKRKGKLWQSSPVGKTD